MTRRTLKLFVSLSFTLCLLTAPSCVTPPQLGETLSTHVDDWRDEVIYQILTDRYANGDVSNDFNVNLSDPSAYHGGDWEGIIENLDYIESLGVTALWISPVVKNVEEDAGFASYHGYWTQDFTRTNPHFGDLHTLRKLVDAAHARGIKVILDIVTNHVGQAFFYDINKNGQPDDTLIGQGDPIGAPLDQNNPTSDFVRITEWDPDFNIEDIQAWTSLGPSGVAPVEFVDYPEINRVAPVPSIFASPLAYNRKGRVTVWGKGDVCDCSVPGNCEWEGPEHCALVQASVSQDACSCSAETNQCQYRDNNACLRTQEILGDFPGGLKDIATTRQDVRDALFEIFARWIELTNVDGFRIDTLKHVEESFWDDFCTRIRAFAKSKGKDNFFMFGEAFDGSDDVLGAYTQGEGVDSVFYFSAYYRLFRWLFLGEGDRTCEVERLHCDRLGCTEDPCGEGAGPFAAKYNGNGKVDGPTSADGRPLNSRELVVNFASNHDVGRFLYFMPSTWTAEEKRRVLHMGLAYVLTIDGVPSLYYGVEQEFAGGNDPANRETMWDPNAYNQRLFVDGAWQEFAKTYDADGDGNAETIWKPFDTQNPTFKWIQKLISIRKELEPLRRGALNFLWTTRGTGGADQGLFVFERATQTDSVVVGVNLLSNRGSTTEASDGSVMVVNFEPGTVLRDALDDSYTVTVESVGCAATAGQGCLSMTVPSKGTRILTRAQ